MPTSVAARARLATHTTAVDDRRNTYPAYRPMLKNRPLTSPHSPLNTAPRGTRGWIDRGRYIRIQRLRPVQGARRGRCCLAGASPLLGKAREWLTPAVLLPTIRAADAGIESPCRALPTGTSLSATGALRRWTPLTDGVRCRSWRRRPPRPFVATCRTWKRIGCWRPEGALREKAWAAAPKGRLRDEVTS